MIWGSSMEEKEEIHYCVADQETPILYFQTADHIVGVYHGGKEEGACILGKMVSPSLTLDHLCPGAGIQYTGDHGLDENCESWIRDTVDEYRSYATAIPYDMDFRKNGLDHLGLVGNEKIDDAIRIWQKDQTDANRSSVLEVVVEQAVHGGKLIYPCESLNAWTDREALENSCSIYTAETTGDKKRLLEIYTGPDRARKEEEGPLCTADLTSAVRILGTSDVIDGVVLNSRDSKFYLSKDDLNFLYGHTMHWALSCTVLPDRAQVEIPWDVPRERINAIWDYLDWHNKYIRTPDKVADIYLGEIGQFERNVLLFEIEPLDGVAFTDADLLEVRSHLLRHVFYGLTDQFDLKFHVLKPGERPVSPVRLTKRHTSELHGTITLKTLYKNENVLGGEEAFWQYRDQFDEVIRRILSDHAYGKATEIGNYHMLMIAVHGDKVLSRYGKLFDTLLLQEMLKNSMLVDGTM